MGSKDGYPRIVFKNFLYFFWGGGYDVCETLAHDIMVGPNISDHLASPPGPPPGNPGGGVPLLFGLARTLAWDTFAQVPSSLPLFDCIRF